MTDDKIRVDCECPMCHKINTVELKTQQWWDWQLGGHIQDVAPELSPNEREMLISGICPTCWNKMFGGNDE